MNNTSEEGPNKNFETVMQIIPSSEINSAETAIKKLEAEGHQLSYSAKDMLAKVDWKEASKSSYEIVSASVGDLFNDKEMHSYGDIKARAQKYGLDLVPAAIAPLIRLNYDKSGEWVTIAMEPIRDNNNNHSVLYVTSQGPYSWLRDFDGKESEEWYDHSKFFFVRK